MPTPEFVLRLREKIGHDSLWLGGVTAVVVRGDEVLLVRRADTGEWAPVTGIIEPGEQPAATAAREALEEAGVVVEATRLVSVDAMEAAHYPNGDACAFLNLTFRCDLVTGRARAADDENTDARWFLIDALPPLAVRYAHRISDALDNEPECRFVR